MDHGLPQRKKSIICLCQGNPLRDPWEESQLSQPGNFQLERWDLLNSHKWKNSDPQNNSYLAIVVDLDMIAKTEPLDVWATKAWRSTFNDMILKSMDSQGFMPTLLAFTRQPSWERAALAIAIGAREITKLSLINEKILELSGQPQSAEESGLAPNNLTYLTTKAGAPSGTNGSYNGVTIPKHAIPFPIDGLEGSSPAIESVRNIIRKSAPLDTSVLIYGPTGSGKELVAKAIHHHSQRTQGPFVPVNCGAIAPGLIEAELFGHIKGAYTGAHQSRDGLFLKAHMGTLFLDEISELPLEFQVKLLRSIQERVIYPVGSNQSVPINVRVITASKDDLDEKVKEGSFREDLLYRLRVIEIQLPSLVERRLDISDIASTILKRLARKHKKYQLEISEPVMEKFLVYHWPGNIRELENSLEHGATLAWAEERKNIQISDLPSHLQFASLQIKSQLQLKDVVHRFEKEYIASTIRRLGGSKEEAAESLGLSLATLYRKLSS